MSHLYVMQNHVGLIKVGRSRAVEARRRAIEVKHQCRATLVAVLNDAGDREEAIHLALEDHRLLGEWFDGTEQARLDILAAVGLDRTTEWPVALSTDERVDEWLDVLTDRMTLTSRDKEIQRVIREMTACQLAERKTRSRWEDDRLYLTFWRVVHMQNAIVDVKSDKRGCAISTGLRGQDGGETVYEPIPHYTSQTNAALSLWPNTDRPAAWEGSAWDCCIAALKAQKARLEQPIPHTLKETA